MTFFGKHPTKDALLAHMQWDETSGADDPAHGIPGWVVMKNTGTAEPDTINQLIEHETAEVARDQQLFDALRQRDFTAAPEPVRKAVDVLGGWLVGEGFGEPQQGMLATLLARVLRKSTQPDPEEPPIEPYSDLELEEAFAGFLMTAWPSFAPKIGSIVNAQTSEQERQSQLSQAIVGLRADVAGPMQMLKRTLSEPEKKKLAAQGKALPDGSFYIETVGDLKNAIQAVGRAKNRDAAVALICRRAKALGRSDLLPDDWPCAPKKDKGD